MRVLDPAPGSPISSPFGMRKHPVTGQLRMHYGSDRATAARIHSATAGRVLEVGYGSGYGYFVRIGDSHHWVRYAHFRAPARVQLGEAVLAGQHIGDAGKTGTATGVHLHWELWLSGKGLVDPELHIGTTPTPTPSPPQEAPEMLYLMIIDGAGRYGKPGERYFAVATGTSFTRIGAEDANAIAVANLAGRSFANVTYAAWEAFQK